MAACSFESKQAISNAAKFGDLLKDVENFISKLTADVRSSSTDSASLSDRFTVCEEALAKLVRQKDALLKKREYCLQSAEARSTCHKEQRIKNESIERLQQKSTDAEEEYAIALKHKSFYDNERLTIASLQTIVRQNIDRQNQPVENKLIRAEDHFSIKSALSGLTVRSVVDKQRLVIEFVNPTQSELASVSMATADYDESQHALKQRSPRSLQVTITYNSQRRIANVTVNVDTLFIDDLVLEAVSTNNIFSLLASLRQRWMKHSRLAAEIEPLRHSYALDWVYAEGLLRVLYGGDASIVCTLQLNNYPDYATNGLTLLSASGLPTGVTLASLQIPASSSLKKALEFLETRLSTASSEHKQ